MAGIVLFGYSDVGYVCLDFLLSQGRDVRLVVTHEDDPEEAKWFRSVAQRARAAGVETITAEIKDGPAVEARIAEIKPDVILSCYYRRMIPSRILAHAKFGAFNMHGSLLPRYRGRAPVNWAILHGETRVGVTLHHMVKRADAGDIVDAEAVPVADDQTAYEAMTNVVNAARIVLARQIDGLLSGTAPRTAQDESQATYFGGRRPEDGRIDWSRPAAQIVNLVRAVAEPYPGAFCDAGGRQLFVWRARSVPGSALPGTVLADGPRPVVAAGEEAVELRCWSFDDGPRIESGVLGLAVGTRIG